MLPFLNSIFNSEKCQAIRSLEKIGAKEAVGSLIEQAVSFEEETRKAAAEALFELGEHSWKDIIRGDMGDFARLAASEIPEAVTLLIDAAKRAVKYANLAYIKVLATALGKTKDIRSAKLLREIVRNKYTYKHSEDRTIYLNIRTAAVSLIRLARAFPEQDLIPPETMANVLTPHADSFKSWHEDMRPKGQSKDCSMCTNETYHTHIDKGLGVNVKDF